MRLSPRARFTRHGVAHAAAVLVDVLLAGCGESDPLAPEDVDPAEPEPVLDEPATLDVRIEAEGWTDWTGQEGLPNEGVFDLPVDDEERMWAATGGVGCRLPDAAAMASAAVSSSGGHRGPRHVSRGVRVQEEPRRKLGERRGLEERERR